MPALPIVDLRETSSPEYLALQLMKVGENLGFFYLVSHGISEELISGMFNLSKYFFENCPDADRARFASNSGEPKPPAFLPAHHTGQQNRFRLLHYPPYVPDADGPSSPDEEDIRAGVHSDYGSLTLLFQEPTDQGGLQVWQNGDWVDVPYVTHAIVVNIGDALEFWTACQLRSTIHRVTFPPGQAPPQSRFSIPFFVTANDETVLEPILPPSNNTATQDSSKAFFGDIARVKGYLSLEPVTALEHRLRREATIGGSATVAATTR
ncbi:2OG-Fe(II)oxygenase superfamily [Fusarium albosuccineum]|uniref:2OG-Fe(II)oxygenase superfamily n=1 Tax=Fusarium albosuccineum TaxID=1237068 RepID=A0A8H4L5E8_9HYPO|nr:2OG-Fe(II)oxygenase superfamily [Fusarium albosuccineum]